MAVGSRQFAVDRNKCIQLQRGDLLLERFHKMPTKPQRGVLLSEPIFPMYSAPAGRPIIRTDISNVFSPSGATYYQNRYFQCIQPQRGVLLSEPIFPMYSAPAGRPIIRTDISNVFSPSGRPITRTDISNVISPSGATYYQNRYFQCIQPQRGDLLSEPIFPMYSAPAGRPIIRKISQDAIRAL